MTPHSVKRHALLYAGALALGLAAGPAWADDITIGNPFGPFAKGRQATDATIANAAARYADGELVGVDRISLHTSDTLAAVVEVEHIRARLGGAAEPSEVSLRVTTVFRLEPDGWKIVHRHADPITSARPTESLVQT